VVALTALRGVALLLAGAGVLGIASGSQKLVQDIISPRDLHGELSNRRVRGADFKPLDASTATPIGAACNPSSNAHDPSSNPHVDHR
jgi:hypothetical protein